MKLMPLGLVLLLCPELPAAGKPVQQTSIRNTLICDFRQYCSRQRLLRTGLAFGAGAIIANTSMDANSQEWAQDRLCTSKTDDWAAIVKTSGEGKYLIPLSIGMAVTGYIFPSREAVSLFGQWGQRTARAYLLGGPAMLLMQQVTGASRPGETEDGSSWNPFKDDNGVSGHAFIGAVPFLTMAGMSQENAPLRYMFYLLSALPAWSRINDNRHYPSQALLGWYMAWEALSAVNERTRTKNPVGIWPWIERETNGICIRVTW